MVETLACRGCHHPLASDAGCALCLPVKPHLVVLAAVDEESVPLALVAQEAVVVLRKQLQAVKAKAKAGGLDYDPILAAEARSIANTVAKVLDSARKVVQDGAEAVESMSFQEKAALFLEWTGSLPGAYRRRLIESLMGQGTHGPLEEPPHDRPTVN